LKLSDVVERVDQAELVTDDLKISGVNEAGRGRDDELEIWLEGPIDSDQPVVADAEHEILNAPGVVRIRDLSEKLPQLLAVFQDSRDKPGISDSATIAEDFVHGERIDIGPNTVVGPGVTVGDGVTFESGVTIRGEVDIGDDVTLHPGVRIESPARIGSSTTIHANSVIGADGFGYEQQDKKHRKIPQVGKVVLGDRVEIGALVAIDRAMYGETVIGAGTKIDNMVQIGHNCKIGENVILISLVGISGSVDVGDNVVMAGQVGCADHVSIADGVTVAARGGITKDITEEGIVVSGNPAEHHRLQLKRKALYRKLPEIKQKLDELEQDLRSLRTEENHTP